MIKKKSKKSFVHHASVALARLSAPLPIVLSLNEILTQVTSSAEW